MDPQTPIDFDFDVRRLDRAALLTEAERVIGALDAELGSEADSPPQDRAAIRLLEELRGEVVEFAAFPDVFAFDEEGFARYGWPIPPGFRELSAHYRFYWMRFPVVLSPLEGVPFTKLECAVEFNPDVGDGRLRPRAMLILPDRQFKNLAEANASVQLQVGGNVDVGAETPRIELQYGAAMVKAAAGAELQAAANAEFNVGPFTFQMRRAEVQHSPAGTEKVFWKLSGVQFTQEDDPPFIVVLQVPQNVGAVHVAAALQAYHRPQFGLPLQRVIDFLGDRLASFFRAGAPIAVIKTWENVLPAAR